MCVRDAHAARSCRAHLCGERTGDFSACSSHEWAPRRVGFTDTSVAPRSSPRRRFCIRLAPSRVRDPRRKMKRVRGSWWPRELFFWGEGLRYFALAPKILSFGRRFFEFLHIYFCHLIINNSRHQNIAYKFREAILQILSDLSEIRIIHSSDRECRLGFVTNVADISIGLFRTIICISIGMSKRFCDPIQSRENQFQMVAHTGLNRR